MTTTIFKTTGRTQAPLRLGRGRGEEHRGVSRAVENRAHESRAERDE